jgi:hypothetical protein
MVSLLFLRVRHWFWGHPNLVDVLEGGAYFEDVIAGTGHIEMSAWCVDCKRRIYWKEEYP